MYLLPEFFKRHSIDLRNQFLLLATTLPHCSYLTLTGLILYPELPRVTGTSYFNACYVVDYATIEGSTMGRKVIASFQLSSLHVDSDSIRPTRVDLAFGARSFKEVTDGGNLADFAVNPSQHRIGSATVDLD